MASNPKELDRAWSFDDVAIVPGAVTTNPQLVEPKFVLGNFEFDLPIIASAMDAVVDIKMAVKLSKMGAAAVLNLEGIQTRYDDTEAVYESIANGLTEYNLISSGSGKVITSDQVKDMNRLNLASLVENGVQRLERLLIMEKCTSLSKYPDGDVLKDSQFEDIKFIYNSDVIRLQKAIFGF